MTFASIFSGAGGFDLGFHRAGFDCLFTAEIDKRASDVLAKLGAPNLGDVTQIDPSFSPDVLVWGSPCQDMSMANSNRAGLAGNKSSLFYHGIRITNSLLARGLRFSIWENVAGSLNSNEGRDFRDVVRAFWQLGPHSLAWRVLDGKYFGVPQTRRRVILVADFGGERAGEILCDSEASRLHSEAVQEHELGSEEVGIHGTLTARNPARQGRPDQIILSGPVHSTLLTNHPRDCIYRNVTFISQFERLRWRTPRESDRLMGWPEDWTERGASGSLMTDNARYFITGNGVIEPVSYWLAVGVRNALRASK